MPLRFWKKDKSEKGKDEAETAEPKEEPKPEPKEGPKEQPRPKPAPPEEKRRRSSARFTRPSSISA